MNRRDFLCVGSLAGGVALTSCQLTTPAAGKPGQGRVGTSKPRIPLAHLPTPIDELPRMSERLGGPRLLMKRDDLTGLATGGNKTRKLEYVAADARAQEADTLVTTGAVQSNHCRQTAAAAARIGMHCVLLLHGEEPEDLPEGNLLLDEYLGAEVRIGTQTLEEAAAELLRDELGEDYDVVLESSHIHCEYDRKV